VEKKITFFKGMAWYGLWCAMVYLDRRRKKINKRGVSFELYSCCCVLYVCSFFIVGSVYTSLNFLKEEEEECITFTTTTTIVTIHTTTYTAPGTHTHSQSSQRRKKGFCCSHYWSDTRERNTKRGCCTFHGTEH